MAKREKDALTEVDRFLVQDTGTLLIVATDGECGVINKIKYPLHK